MFFFLGFAIGSLYLPSLGDKYGRKKPFVISSLIELVGQSIVIYMAWMKEVPDSGKAEITSFTVSDNMMIVYKTMWAIFFICGLCTSL